MSKTDCFYCAPKMTIFLFQMIIHPWYTPKTQKVLLLSYCYFYTLLMTYLAMHRKNVRLIHGCFLNPIHFYTYCAQFTVPETQKRQMLLNWNSHSSFVTYLAVHRKNVRAIHGYFDPLKSFMRMTQAAIRGVWLMPHEWWKFLILVTEIPTAWCACYFHVDVGNWLELIINLRTLNIIITWPQWYPTKLLPYI